MNTRTALQRVAVTGGGIVAHCAAIAFASALPQAEVTLVSTPPDPAALADRLPALDPRGLALLARLGVGEAELVAGGGATHRVGTCFDWGAEPFAIGEGDGVTMLAGAALHQLWRAHGDGPYDALVPGAALARAERFVHPADDRGPLLSRIAYSLRLDPDRTTAMLARAAQAAGVRIVSAKRIAVARTDERITAIDADGARLSADLFIDAGGPKAALAGPDIRWIEWHDTLPANRLLLASVAARPSPTDRYEATGDGWTARWPLGDRTITGFAYAAETTGDAQAKRLFPDAEQHVAIRPRRQAAPFAGNMLALGDAAAALGPLGWLGLPLALAQLDLALELMPAREDGPLLAAEYNRRAALAAERIHAYAAAFYLIGSAARGAFWDALHARALPEELSVARTQFAQRGTLPPLEEAMVPRGTWQQALIGLGVRPVREDPMALSVPHASAVAALGQLRAAVAALPSALPSYPDYLGMMIRKVTR